MGKKNRVIIYIDGFNLYYGLKSKGWKKYYWLDLVSLSEALLKPQQKLERCHYFTARINRSSSRGQSAKRQSIWLDALDTLEDLTCHFGHYLQKRQKCQRCGSEWTIYEEKMTDVNIATQLILDAYENKFDTALVISGDSDLSTPIEKVLDRFPTKKIVVVFPPNRHSNHLIKIATSSFILGETKLRQNQLPEMIVTQTGHELKRPPEWG